VQVTQEVLDIVEKANVLEDVKQDFYIKWMEMEPLDFPTPGQLRAYVFLTMRHMAGNHLHKERNRKRLESDHYEDIVRGLGLNYSPDDPAHLEEARGLILTKLDSLSPLLRMTLEMYYLDGRTPREIAEAFEGDTEEAVRKRITRARNITKGVA